MTKPVNRPYLRKGFPPHKPPANAAVRLAALAAAGHRMVGIARALNTSRDTLRRWIEEDPALAEAVEFGREAYRMELESPLKRAAKKGNIVAAMFLLKTLFGYREGDQSTEANRVQITFELPAALSPEDFRAKVIEHAPENTALPVPAKSLVRS